MGMVALRGIPDDYDEWERLGAAGWAWDGVLPYFRQLEHDLDFGGELHGRDGPTPIRRVTPDRLDTARACGADIRRRRARCRFVADMNADFRDGYCALPMSNSPQVAHPRRSAISMPTVRARQNLTILPRATVSSLLLDGRRATGVEGAPSTGGAANSARAR